MDISPYSKEDDRYAVYNADNSSYISAPKPSLNGGLYTGDQFHQNAPYRNFPNVPDSVHLHTVALSSANPPPGVENQFPDAFRPGNNMPDVQGMSLNKFSSSHAIVCAKK